MRWQGSWRWGSELLELGIPGLNGRLLSDGTAFVFAAL